MSKKGNIGVCRYVNAGPEALYFSCFCTAQQVIMNAPTKLKRIPANVKSVRMLNPTQLVTFKQVVWHCNFAEEKRPRSHPVNNALGFPVGKGS